MKYKFALVCLLFILTMKNMMSQQTHQNMTLTLNYLVYLPHEYNTTEETKWPLILFLHGAGERGDSLNQVKRHGPPKLVEEGKDFEFIII